MTPESVGDLTDRYEFGDACVREVNRRQTYGKGATSTASVVIELMRKQPEPEWVTLRLELSDVRDFRIIDVNTFSWVLLDDLHVVRDATGRLHLDLDNVARSDFRTPDQMAEESHLYFSAREVRWAELAAPRCASAPTTHGGPREAAEDYGRTIPPVGRSG
ncbi:hypothetical protein GCM10010532_054650 [Dactylosporangium siamense]|uniref:Uncharacterized protein n=1 Tax=Dactylosporangium siamense TaxID=685454 RepID=A0A919PLM3_9ACTN|nr:hypothetical protein Dsi01nite_040800 [Dactylosporangium siamense]